MYSCFQIRVVVINKHSNFHSNVSKGSVESETVPRNQGSKSIKLPNDVKIHDRVMYSCLEI